MTKINLKLWIDEVEYKEKPSAQEAGAIRMRESQDKSFDYSLDEIEEAVNCGCTLVLAELKDGGKSDKDFVSQQIFGVDIDNKEEIMTVEEAQNICKNNNLFPCLIYHTFSHTAALPKYRMLFAFDKAEINKGDRDKINKHLISLFNSDQSCKDASRLFFGGKSGCVVHKQDVVNSLENIKLAANNYNKTPKLSKEALELCKSVNFREYVTKTADGEWVGNYFDPCPFCGGHGDFTINKENNFTCYGENGLRNNGKHPFGNIVSYMMEINHLSYNEAVTELYQLCGREKPSDVTPEENLQNKEEYLNNYNAANMVKDFWLKVKNVSTIPISTGFSKLDEALDGGIREGLIFLGALSSLGKTTFLLQMADQIASMGQDVLIFSLEMSKYELIAKSVSRNTYNLCAGNVRLAKTTIGITQYDRYKNYSEEEKTLIKNSFIKQHKISKNIYIIEGLGDLGVTKVVDTVKNHIELTGNSPVVIIDYLQILAPYNERWAERQNIDKSVLELKRLSRDCKIPVIAISAFNRMNYSQKEAMMSAFKESGAIEYGSDILMALQFREIEPGVTKTGKPKAITEIDIEMEKSKSNDVRIPRKVELKILKNRNGKTGYLVPFDYYPAFNFFTEKLGKKDLHAELLDKNGSVTKLPVSENDVDKKSLEEEIDKMLRG